MLLQEVKNKEDILEEFEITNDKVSVYNCGRHKRKIHINSCNPEAINIGCFRGTKKEAIREVRTKYKGNKYLKDYEEKILLCFYLMEQRIKISKKYDKNYFKKRNILLIEYIVMIIGFVSSIIFIKHTLSVIGDKSIIENMILNEGIFVTNIIFIFIILSIYPIVKLIKRI